MAVQTIAYLKALFVNGYIPVTQDYTDLIDTLHSLENTGAFVDNGDGTYTFDDGSGNPFTIDSNTDLSDYVTQQNLTDALNSIVIPANTTVVRTCVIWISVERYWVHD